MVALTFWLIEEDSFQFNISVGKLNSRSRKTIIGKCNATPLVDAPNNNIPTRKRSRHRGLCDVLRVDSAIENVATMVFSIHPLRGFASSKGRRLDLVLY